MSSWFKILRPSQWTKNFVVFAGIIFARHLNNLSDLVKVGETFVIFTLLVCGGYVINDILDAAEDQLHPGNRKDRSQPARSQIRMRAGSAPAS